MFTYWCIICLSRIPKFILYLSPSLLICFYALQKHIHDIYCSIGQRLLCYHYYSLHVTWPRSQEGSFHWAAWPLGSPGVYTGEAKLPTLPLTLHWVNINLLHLLSPQTLHRGPPPPEALRDAQSSTLVYIHTYIYFEVLSNIVVFWPLIQYVSSHSCKEFFDRTMKPFLNS